jgi:ABC-2 type transport system ATP-binding protein
MPDTTLLDVRNVVKRYGSVTAVAGLTFRVARGEIFALLGPNGAGKTTTIRMVVGIIRPDEGAVAFSLHGEQSAPPRPSELGYLPEDRGLYRDVPIL